MKMQRAYNSKYNKELYKVFILPDLDIYYKDIIIKILQYWQMNRYKDWRNRVEVIIPDQCYQTAKGPSQYAVTGLLFFWKVFLVYSFKYLVPLFYLFSRFRLLDTLCLSSIPIAFSLAPFILSNAFPFPFSWLFFCFSSVPLTTFVF